MSISFILNQIFENAIKNGPAGEAGPLLNKKAVMTLNRASDMFDPARKADLQIAETGTGSLAVHVVDRVHDGGSFPSVCQRLLFQYIALNG